MSNFNYLEYKGHSIFKDQPNHSYFDKPFEDPGDCLFQYLHEIEAHFAKPEQELEDINCKSFIVIDPRTQKPINKLYYDHTQEEKTKIFHSPRRSVMSEKQHELGVRVLNALQSGSLVTDEDLYDWSKLEELRHKERLNFQNFVSDFSQNSKEKMYTPCRKLLELYQKWYNSKANKLRERYPAETYNTHLGLPQVKQCKNIFKDQQVHIKNVEIISKLGMECKWHKGISQEFKKFNYSIESYTQVYNNSEDLKEGMEDKLQKQFIKIIDEEIAEFPRLYMPLESLLFLLTVGDYIDMPTEMLLNIKENENTDNDDFNKYIIMDQPLPARQAGWHTYQQVVEQAVRALVSIKQTPEEEHLSNKEIQKSSNNFKVFTIQEFMQNTSRQPDKLCIFSKILTKYQLTSVEDEKLEIFTTLDQFVENKDLSIKLEYKPQFGCEISTKYELLKKWIKLKLFNSHKSFSLRLDVTNYQTLVEESFSLNKIEELLYTNYHINCQELLNNLYEFLKMLMNMPVGRYMLRFNAKFKDKIMLCKPSKEITQNTINLHQLLQMDVTDLEFMSQQDFLLIDANLCSLMHLQHSIIPAAFSPRAVVERKFQKSYNNIMKQKKPLLKAKEIKKPKNKSAKKRARRRQRMIENFKAQRDEQELQREIELDRKMLVGL